MSEKPLADFRPLPPQLPATEADFDEWLLQLLPGVRAALVRQGFSKVRSLVTFQHYLRQRNIPPQAT